MRACLHVARGLPQLGSRLRPTALSVHTYSKASLTARRFPLTTTTAQSRVYSSSTTTAAAAATAAPSSSTATYAAILLGIAGGGVLLWREAAAEKSAQHDHAEASRAQDEAEARFLESQSVYIPTCKESDIKIFAGSGNPALAVEVATRLGLQLGRLHTYKFTDGEIGLQVYDSVRNKDVYIIQPTCAPIHDNLMELILLITTMRRASAARITAVVPYFGYSRQLNSKNGTRSLGGADVARLLETAGVDQVVAVDLHRSQIQGFFDAKIPVENLDTCRTVSHYLATKDLHDPVLVSPGSSVFRAKNLQTQLANKLEEPPRLALLYVSGKRGVEDQDTQEHHEQIHEKLHNVELVGEVKGSDVIIVDDMIDSASRVTRAARTLKQHGARRVMAFATHGLLTGDAVQRIHESDLDEVVTFNTVPASKGTYSPKVVQLTVSALIAEAIRRIHTKDSVSALMAEEKGGK